MRSDRRSRRRRQTIEEILDAALAVMGEEGVAGLSLAEVARRVGMQPPSLYQYFPSKLGLYDALFAQGMAECLAYVTSQVDEGEPVERIRARVRAFARWAVANPLRYQLSFWRPVPGFEPSREAMEPSVALLDVIRRDLEAAVDAGALRPDAATEEAVSLATALGQGVITQHLANEPERGYGEGRFTALVEVIIQMFLSHYAPEGDPT